MLLCVGEYPMCKPMVSEPERPEPNPIHGPRARTGMARRRPQATKRVPGETVRLQHERKRRESPSRWVNSPSRNGIKRVLDEKPPPFVHCPPFRTGAPETLDHLVVIGAISPLRSFWSYFPVPAQFAPMCTQVAPVCIQLAPVCASDVSIGGLPM